MIKLTLLDGLVVEMDTTAQLAEIVRMFREQPVPEPQVEVPVEATPVDAATLRRFLRGLPDIQRSVLDFLYQSPESRTDEQLCAFLEIPGNRQLGGVMGAIARRAIGLGMTIDDAFAKDSWQSEGVRHYTYTMTGGMRAVMTS